MLQHMFLGDPQGNYDRILDFSTAVTGSLYFVPTADFLDDPPPLPADSTTAPGAALPTPEPPEGSAADRTSTDGDSSLGIGGLRGHPW
jgi:putative iron-dependent peroxidase